MDITAPSISLKCAADAAGLSPRWLRDLLAADGFTMLGHAGRKAGGWHRCAAVDVVRLRLLRRMMDHGFTPAEAATVLAGHIDPHLLGLTLCGVPLPVSWLQDRLAGGIMHVSRDPDFDDLDVWFGAANPDADVTTSFDLGVIGADALAALDDADTSTSAGPHDRRTGTPAGAEAGVPTHSTTTQSAGLPAVGIP